MIHILFHENVEHLDKICLNSGNMILIYIFAYFMHNYVITMETDINYLFMFLFP